MSEHLCDRANLEQSIAIDWRAAAVVELAVANHLAYPVVDARNHKADTQPVGVDAISKQRLDLRVSQLWTLFSGPRWRRCGRGAESPAFQVRIYFAGLYPD